MVTSAHVEASSEPEAKQKTPARETPVLERRAETKLSQKPEPKAIPGREEGSFHSSLIEYNRMQTGSRLLDALSQGGRVTPDSGNPLSGQRSFWRLGENPTSMNFSDSCS